MAKKKHKRIDEGQASQDVEDAQAAATPPGPSAKMKVKEYEREMRRLHGELVAMQEWVKATGAIPSRSSTATRSPTAYRIEYASTSSGTPEAPKPPPKGGRQQGSLF